MLKIFHLDVYAMIDPRYTISFLIPHVDIRFDILPDILLDQFSISIPICETIIAKRVYRNFHVSLSHRVTHVDIVKLDMVKFDVILRMH